MTRLSRVAPAFTLVELLVVVAIIALLLGILLPALGKAREATKRVYCQANLRGMAMSVLTYSHEYAGFQPTLGGGDFATNETYQISVNPSQTRGGVPAELGGHGANTSLDRYNWYYKLLMGNYLTDTGKGWYLCPSNRIPWRIEEFCLPSHYAAPFSHRSSDLLKSFALPRADRPTDTALLHEVALCNSPNWGFWTGVGAEFAGYINWAPWATIHDNGGAGTNNFAFVDGHVDTIARLGDGTEPGTNQLAESEVPAKVRGRAAAYFYEWAWSDDDGRWK